MRLIKLGLANINTKVGDFENNISRVINYAQKTAEEKCTIVCFSEQVISGYPCEDLVQWNGFVEKQWEYLVKFVNSTEHLKFRTVFILGITIKEGGHIFNCAAVVCNGKIIGIVPKEKLPIYGVFYESRTFSPGIPGKNSYINGVPFGDHIFNFPFGILGVEVCEDLWSSDGPMKRRAYSGAELIVNISSSPWRAGIVKERIDIISTKSYENQVTLVYTNQVGGNDSLVFDGGGFVNQNGKMIIEAKRWCEGYTTQIVDLDKTTSIRKENSTWRTDCELFLMTNKLVNMINYNDGPVANQTDYNVPTPEKKNYFLPNDFSQKDPENEYFDDLIEAMKTGLSGYFEKTGVFKKIGIALSGGKDSAITLIIAWLYALDRFSKLSKTEQSKELHNFIECFSMPTKFNSEATKSIARQICEELGVGFKEISIEEAFGRELEAVKSMLSNDETLTRIAIQNIQVRIRASRMWNWANSCSGLWLQTGNMSEKAVGYTTIGGDLEGAYSLIGNLPKTIIIDLLAYIGKKYQIKSIAPLLATPASAELEENQEDEKDLMPFPVLDACFALFAGEKLMPNDLYKTIRAMWTDDELKQMRSDYKPKMLKEWIKMFIRKFSYSIYKWVQAPQSVHLSSLDLDRERALQIPVVWSEQWLDIDEIDKI